MNKIKFLLTPEEGGTEKDANVIIITVDEETTRFIGEDGFILEDDLRESVKERTGINVTNWIVTKATGTVQVRHIENLK